MQMQQQTLNKNVKESPTYIDPEMATRTHIHLGQKDVFCQGNESLQ
jgi:hypothetical protein